MSNALLVDLSRWNGPADLSKPMVMDWAKAREKGVVGIIVRIGSINDVTGECYLDDRVFEIVEDATKHDMPMGYYFYARPKWSGKKQADFILDTMRRYALPMQLDMWGDVEVVAATPADTTASVVEMMTGILAEYPRQAGVYTRQNLWDKWLSPDPLWSRLKLWAARYNSTLTGPWSDGYLKFRDWQNWHYWQYSATNNGLAAEFGFPSGSVSIDLDQYNGTAAEFVKAYNLDPLREVKDELENLGRLIAGVQVEVDTLRDGIQRLAQLHASGHSELVAADAILEEKARVLEAWAKGIGLK